MMEKLIAAKLFGDGMIPVHTEKNIRKYNECLEEMGIPPTTRAEFHIDGMGWSPEIASERDCLTYLSHGDANTYGIILTPEQYRLPIHAPHHSFDRDLISAFFRACKNQIRDITFREGIWIDLDHELSYFAHPRDLLVIDSVTVHAHTTGGLMDAAKRQRNLAKRFESEWSDKNLMGEIIKSAEEFGNLLYQSFVIPPFPYSNIRNFYTRAFGGVYIIRDGIKNFPYFLALESEDTKSLFGLNAENVMLVSSPRLIDTLLNEGILAIDFMHYREHSEIIHLKKEALVVSALSHAHPDVRYQLLTTAARDKFIHELRDTLPGEFFELERLQKSLAKGNIPTIWDISEPLRRALAHPSYDLPPDLVEVLWQMVTDNEPFDILRLYTFNKRRFFSWYRDWTDARKEWAVSMLVKNYVPWVKRKKER